MRAAGRLCRFPQTKRWFTIVSPRWRRGSSLSPPLFTSRCSRADAPSAEVMVVEVASLGLFILDTFEWRTVAEDGTATTTKRDEGIIGGGGTYAVIGSRIWLPATRVGILVDRGYDWPHDLDEQLDAYGSEMWVFREQPEYPTTRALNLYTGEHRGTHGG